MYGFNCSRECGYCYNGTSCNPVNGHCPENKCDYGYSGMACDKRECPSGLFYRQNFYLIERDYFDV
jgi:hypothetical protein